MDLKDWLFTILLCVIFGLLGAIPVAVAIFVLKAILTKLGGK